MTKPNSNPSRFIQISPIAADRMERKTTRIKRSALRTVISSTALVAAICLTGCAQLTHSLPQSIVPTATESSPGVRPSMHIAPPNTEQHAGSGGGVTTAGHVQPVGGNNSPSYANPQGEIQQVAAQEDPYVARQYPNPPTTQPLPGGYTQGQYGQSQYGQSQYGQVQGNVYAAQQPPPPVTGSTGSFPPRQFGPRNPSGLGSGVIPGLGPAFPPYGTDPVYSPTVREADLIINGFPARTGRIMFGGAVNSDAGVTGQITIDERNFNIRRWPRSFQDLFSGRAFRGAGETLRIEAAPGSQFDRYTGQWATPNLFGYLPLSFSVSGFLYDRRFNDWDENRLGLRTNFGYRITPDLSLTFGFGGQRVKVDNARATNPIFDLGPPLTFLGNRVIDDLALVTGENRKSEIYSGSVGITHNTRDTPIQPSSGHYFEFQYEKNFGDFDYSKFDLEFRQYWLLASRADGSGKQTISYSTQLGFTGDDTPIFDRYYAGGYATLRGFDFRGVGPRGIMQPDVQNQFTGPVSSGINVGGQFQWVNSVEYMFPITADDAFRGVLFTDFGTVESSAKIDSDNFRVAPGLGLRIAIPALGPAPLAFDYAFPIETGEGDEERPFSFYMSVIR